MTCIIVRQGAYEEYDRLKQTVGHRLPVIWDRRHTAPGVRYLRYPNRREAPPPSWTKLGFIVVVDRPAAWARAALSAREADHYIAAQAAPASQ